MKEGWIVAGVQREFEDGGCFGSCHCWCHFFCDSGLLKVAWMFELSEEVECDKVVMVVPMPRRYRLSLYPTKASWR